MQNSMNIFIVEILQSFMNIYTMLQDEILP